jgi:hypothetical protein
MILPILYNVQLSERADRVPDFLDVNQKLFRIEPLCNVVIVIDEIIYLLRVQRNH